MMATESEITHPSLRGARTTSVGSNRMDDSSSRAGSSIYKQRRTVKQNDRQADTYKQNCASSVTHPPPNPC